METVSLIFNFLLYFLLTSVVVGWLLYLRKKGKRFKFVVFAILLSSLFIFELSGAYSVFFGSLSTFNINRVSYDIMFWRISWDPTLDIMSYKIAWIGMIIGFMLVVLCRKNIKIDNISLA